MKPCPNCEAGQVAFPSTTKMWTSVGSVIRLSAAALTEACKANEAKLIVRSCDADECGYAEVAIEPVEAAT